MKYLTRSIEMGVFIGFMVGFFIGVAASLFAISLCVVSDERENFYTDTDDDKIVIFNETNRSNGL